jgi:hypothetical protein
MCVYDIGEDYLVMEFLEGRTLQALLKERDLSFQQVLGLLSPWPTACDPHHCSFLVSLGH